MIDHFVSWRELAYVVIDIESTGFSTQYGDRIVELAAVRVERMTITAKWHSLLNPGRPIPDDASRVHRIYDEDVDLAPRFADKARSFAEFCSGAVPCAHKADFDRQFVLAELSMAKMAPTPELLWPTWLDTLAWVRSTDRFAGEKVENNLTAACKRRGITLDGAHGAAADAAATALLLASLAHDMPTCTVSELLRRQCLVDSAYNKRWDAAKASRRVS